MQAGQLGEGPERDSEQAGGAAGQQHPGTAGRRGQGEGKSEGAVSAAVCRRCRCAASRSPNLYNLARSISCWCVQASTVQEV